MDILNIILLFGVLLNMFFLISSYNSYPWNKIGENKGKKNRKKRGKKNPTMSQFYQIAEDDDEDANCKRELRKVNEDINLLKKKIKNSCEEKLKNRKEVLRKKTEKLNEADTLN